MTGAAMTEADLAAEMVGLARSLFDRGLSPGSSGNLSARLPGGGFLMTPTNASLGALDPARLSRLSAEGAHLGGDPPTKEAFLHLAMYAGRPTLGAVVHLHSSHAVAWSCLAGLDPADALPPLTPYLHMRVGPVALAPYAWPGDPSLGPEIARLAARHAGILIANHGPVVGAATLRDAVFAAEELEEGARIALLTRPHATRRLPPEALSALDAIALRPPEARP